MAGNETKVIITGEDKTGAAFSSVRNGISSITSSYGALTALMTGGVAGAMIATIKHNIDLGDELNDLSKKYGASVETLAGFTLAAHQSGTSMEAIAKGLGKLSVQLADSPDKFTALGISTKSATEAMIQMADIFAAMPDGAEKTALAIKLFGKSGADMIPLLDEGTEGMRRMVKTGGELAKITAENAKLSDEFNDNMAIMKAASAGASMAMTSHLIPALTEISKAMAQAAKDGGTLKAIWVGLGGLGAALFTDEFIDPAVKAKKTVNELEIQLAKLEGVNGLGKLWYGKDLDQQISDTKAKLTKAVSDLDAIVNKPAESTEKNKPDQEAVNKALRASCSLRGGDWVGGKCVMPDPTKEKKDPRDKNGYLDELFREEAKSRLFVEEFIGKNRTSIERVEQQREMIGMREKERTVLEATRKLEDDATEARQRAFRDIKDVNLYEQAIEGINSALEVQKKQMADATASVYDYARSWESGATVAIVKYLDEVDNMAAKSGKLYSDVFNGFDESLTKMAVSGDYSLSNLKKSFSGMADSIISDMIRMQIQESITKPMAQAVKDKGGFSGVFSAAGDWMKSALPSFAVGIDYVPRDMIAQIHKGEKILTAEENKSGGQVGTTNQFIVDMRGASVEAVQRLESLVMSINGSIERRALTAMSQARVRGA